MKKRSSRSGKQIRKKNLLLEHSTLLQVLIVIFLGSLIFIMVKFVFAQNGSSKNTPPKIETVSPQSGPLGTQLTLTGSRFTPTTNDILVHGKELLADLSSDGTTIVFTLPATAPCQPNAACPIKVSNDYGISNAIPFKVGEKSTTEGYETPITVLTPNGGEICIPGEYCAITWAAYQNGQLVTHEVVGNKDMGLVEVKIALVKDTATNSSDPTNLIVGWIEAQPDRIAAIRDYAWYAATVTDADTQFTYNVDAGSYKILLVARDASGQYTLWNTNTNIPGNFDVSDAAFTVMPRK